MSNITRLQVKTKNPKIGKLYSKYDKIKLNHCQNLLEFLYENKSDFWINPLTTKEIYRGSDIVVSFLSKCYYKWGDNRITLNSENLTFKEHILKFIDLDYLFDIPTMKKNKQLPQSPQSPQAAQAAQAATLKPKSITPPGITPPGSKSPRSPQAARAAQAATLKPKSITPPGITPPGSKSPQSPQAARGQRIAPILPAFIPVAQSNAAYAGPRPGYVFKMGAQGLGYYLDKGSGKSPLSPQAARGQRAATAAAAVATAKPLSFKPKTAKDMNKNSDLLSPADCIYLVEEIEEKTRNKTPEQLKKVKVMNPVTKKEIGLDSIILQSYLSKCYYTFYNPQMKKSIEKIVNIGELIDLEKQRLLDEKKKEEERLKREKEEEEKKEAHSYYTEAD